MTHVLKLLARAGEVEALSEALWALPGVQGIEEAAADGGLFRPEGEFEVLEFGSEAARRCAQWLSSEAYRGGGALLVKVYLDPPGNFDVEAALAPVRTRFQFETLAFEAVEARDYLEEYRRSVKGTAFGDNLWVGPPWEEAPAGHQAFFVEPGLAFGTGEHPTTQLCLERLQELSREGLRPTRICDLGTGSGVLAVAARRFFPQASLVVTDLDPLCEQEVARTFALNGMSLDGVQGLWGNAGTAAALRRQGESFPLLISNIYSEVLRGLRPDIESLLAPGGRWLISGVLDDDSGQALEREAAHNLRASQRRVRERVHARLVQEGLRPETERWLFLEFLREKK